MPYPRAFSCTARAMVSFGLVPLSCLLLLSLLTLPVVAQESDDGGTDKTNTDKTSTDKTNTDETKVAKKTFEESVDVTAPAPGYAAERATSATKSSVPLLETPQAVTVVTHERLTDLQPVALQDALDYAAGVRSDAYGLDARTDSVLVRGASPDKYLDGLRQHFNYYTSTTRTDPYLLERIEVLRGPSSMLYGQGSIAGIVNQVTKHPLSVERREVDFQIGSFDRRQVRADLTGPVTEDGNWLYRVVALARESGTQVDHVPDDRYLFAPSVTWRPGTGTEWTFQLRWQQDESGSTTQFFPWTGTVLSNPNGQISSETFVGEPGFDRYDSENLSVGWQFQRALSDRWTVRQNLRWSQNEVDYRSIYANSFSSPGNVFLDEDQRIMDRIGYVSLTDVEMLTLDQHVEGMFDVFGARHQVLIGLDAVRFEQEGESASDFSTRFGGGVPPLDVYAPVYSGYTPPSTNALPKSELRQAGVYVQDHIEIGDHWRILAGLRHDRTTDELEGSRDTATSERSSATTGRLGILYVAGGWSTYVSYSESFTPVAGTNFYGERYEPRYGEQVEAGIKYQPRGRALSVSVAAYELRETNRLTTDPQNPLNSIQAGKTETTGFELEATGRIGGKMGRHLDVSGHYNYLDLDEQLTALPEHQAGLWLRRGFDLDSLGKLSVGVGARYFSSFQDGRAPEVPELTLFDALLSWDLEGNRRDWRVSLNVRNLEDETYVSTCLSRGDCFYGARRTAILTTGTRF